MKNEMSLRREQYLKFSLLREFPKPDESIGMHDTNIGGERGVEILKKGQSWTF